MIGLNDNEVDEIVDLAYEEIEKYLFKYVSKKELENIDITINLESYSDSFDIDINIDLNSDVELPETLSEDAIDAALEKVDEYIEKRNKELEKLD